MIKIKKNLYISVLMAVVLWLVSLAARSIGPRCYTLDWILSSNFYLLAALIAVCAFLIDKRRFSLSVLMGIFLGVAFGELLGKNPEGAELGLGHYGWIIWLMLFFASALFGILMELFHYRKAKRSM